MMPGNTIFFNKSEREPAIHAITSSYLVPTSTAAAKEYARATNAVEKTMIASLPPNPIPNHRMNSGMIENTGIQPIATMYSREILPMLGNSHKSSAAMVPKQFPSTSPPTTSAAVTPMSAQNSA